MPVNHLELPCQSGPQQQPPPEVTLNIQAVPATGSTTDPAPGSHGIILDNVVVLTATPTPGNSFLGWTGPVADPSNPTTTVIMNQSQTVTAQFTALTTTIAGNIAAKSGPANARVWTLSLYDNGPAGAGNAVIPSFTLVQTAGAACTPVVNTASPLAVRARRERRNHRNGQRSDRFQLLRRGEWIPRQHSLTQRTTERLRVLWCAPTSLSRRMCAQDFAVGIRSRFRLRQGGNR